MEPGTWNLKLPLLLLLLCPLQVFGQESIGQVDQALEVLSAEARAAVERPATALLRDTRTTASGRIDRQSGIRRAVYAPEAVSTRASNPESAARLYLREYHDQFGLSADLDELRLDAVVESPGGYHVTFQQILDRMPVYLGDVKVNLDRSLRPISAFNNIYESLTTVSGAVNSTPTISRQRARQIVRDGISQQGAAAGRPELFVYPSDPAQLVWKVAAWPAEAAAEWVMLVDAHSGRFVYGHNAATKLHAEHTSSGDHAGTDDRSRSTVSAGKTRTDGSGLVFDPDPLTTGGVSYGGSFRDNEDADSEALTGELFSSPLRGLTERSGQYYLEGPYVRIVGTDPRWYPGSDIDSVNYTPPTESSPDGFAYTRAHDDFEAVNAYYHIDKSQRYLQSLDPSFSNLPSTAVKINPHGEGQDDNSFYYPSLNMISFGQGGVDDAEDASVVWHEYGHVLLNSSAEGLLGGSFGTEARSFHEGWSDYWASSYRRSLAAARGGLSSSDYEWRELFPWDAGNGSFWPGRHVSHQGTYPSSMTYSNSYRDGLLWASTLMEIFTTLEAQNGTLQARSVSDRINLQSHYFLNTNPYTFTFRDAAVALLEADLVLYDGQHRSLLLDHLQARGFIDPSLYGPQVSHDSNTDVTYSDGRLTFEVAARPREFDVDEVKIRYRRLGESGTYQTTTLAPANDTLYVGEVRVSEDPGLVEYYIEARDVLGISNVVPNDGSARSLLAEIGAIEGSSLLAKVQATEGWNPSGSGWRIEGTVQDAAHLVLEPMTLAENTDLQSYLVLTHEYNMKCSTAGNLKISTNGGNTWQVLHPYTEYPASNLTVPTLEGQSGFCREEPSDGPLRAAFDLTDYAGERIQLRVDYAAEGSEEPRGYWDVQEATIYQATLDSRVRTSRQLTLQGNYPNPFTNSTTVHFTIPEAAPITLEVYDVVGRRVRILEQRQYPAGTHTITFERNDLANGIYFLQLTTPTGRVAQPVRVLK